MSNSNEMMKVTLTLNGKQAEVEFSKEQLVALGLVEEKKTGYERVEPGKDYWCVVSSGDAMPWVDNHTIYGDAIYELANYYSDKTVAENNARADKLMCQLRRFAAENGGIPSVEDWKDRSINKYYIRYDYDNGKLRFDAMLTWRDSFQIYFKSKEACKKAIEEFKDELLWYFTEYQAMLY